MKETLQNYRIDILTPVHIGSGETLNPLLFDQKGDMLRIYRMEDVAPLIENPLELFRFKLPKTPRKGDQLGLRRIIPQAKLESIPPIKKLPIWDEEEGDITGHQIDRFISEDTSPYLPGSSLKGTFLHAIEHAKRANPRDFQASFAMSDLHLETHTLAIQRGERLTAAKKPSNQTPDNLKEWLISGTSFPIKAHYRRSSGFALLSVLQRFADDYLEYQKSYFEHLIRHADFDKFPYPRQGLEEMVSSLEKYQKQNTKESPLLILGSNTHRFSKSLELLRKPQYQKNPGKKNEHPVSRLLVLDKEHLLTLPGLAKMRPL